MAVDSKFFNIPFGTSGDRATIPEASQPSGAVSYTQGFGPDYERDPDTDPAAKRVPRDETNEYIYQITNALKFIQLYGFPQYTSVADGGPANYPLSARVRYDVGAGAGMQAWVSLVATNTAVPGADATKWALDEAFSLTALEATQAEANAGLIGTKIITPRRMSSAVQRGAWNYATAAGAINALTATLSPVPAAIVAGMVVNMRVNGAFINTGACTLNLNGLGALPITDNRGIPLKGGEMVNDVELTNHDGTSWSITNMAFATETYPGIAELGATAELTAGTDLTRVPSIGRMAAQIQNGSWQFGVDTGAANAMVLTLIPALAAYVAGANFIVKPAASNTGAATINVNGLGVKNIVDSTGAALQANDIRSTGQLVWLMYNGVSFELMTTWTASTTLRGPVRIATQAEANAGTVNNAGITPATMAQSVQSGGFNYAVDTGAVNALVLTLAPAPAALIPGLSIIVSPAVQNTGAATINVNGLGVKSIVDNTGAALAAGDLRATGQLAQLVYDGTNFILVDVWTASQTIRGAVRLATQAEANAGITVGQAIAPATMAQAVQSGRFNFATAAGTVDALVLTLAPAPAAYVDGMVVNTRLAGANTISGVTVNLNALGVIPLVMGNGAVLNPGDINIGPISMMYRAGSFYIVNEFPATEGGRGVVELASAAETTAGTDLTRPAAVARVAAQVQTAKWTVATPGGTPNALTAALVPVPAALTAGMSVTLLVTTPNTGAATLNLNGLGVKPILNVFGAALTGGELSGPTLFLYDGANWQAQVSVAGLSANRTYFVNATTGNDSNNGLTAGTAFATIQKAVTTAALVNLNGFNILISVADGTYAGVVTAPLTGSGTVTVQGNSATPANVQVNGAAGLNGIFAKDNGYVWDGLSPLGPGGGAHSFTCGGCSTNIRNMHWRANANSAQIFSGVGGAITIGGTHNVAGAGTGSFGHLFCTGGGVMQTDASNPPSLNFSAASGFTNGLVVCGDVSSIAVTYTAFTNPGNAIGKKFNVSNNGVINVGGAGINYFPGASAGTQTTGGQYV